MPRRLRLRRKHIAWKRRGGGGQADPRLSPRGGACRKGHDKRHQERRVEREDRRENAKLTELISALQEHVLQLLQKSAEVVILQLLQRIVRTKPRTLTLLELFGPDRRGSKRIFGNVHLLFQLSLLSSSIVKGRVGISTAFLGAGLIRVWVDGRFAYMDDVGHQGRFLLPLPRGGPGLIIRTTFGQLHMVFECPAVPETEVHDPPTIDT